VEKLLYTVNEAAALLSLSRSKLYAEIQQGRLRPLKIGTAVRFTHHELRRYIDAYAAEQSVPVERAP